MQVLDVTKHYCDLNAVRTKTEIQDWIDKEFDPHEHSAMEFLLSEWHETSENHFVFFKTHQRVFICVCDNFVSFLFSSGDDFQHTTSLTWSETWEHVDHFSETSMFYHTNGTQCNCCDHWIWAGACEHIKRCLHTHNKKDIHFNPKGFIDCRPHNVAKGFNTCCFTIHIDDLNVRHPKVKGTGYTTIGIQIHNLKQNTRRHQFFLRTSFLPGDKEFWTVDHQLQIMSKELNTMQHGIPMPVEGKPDEFQILKFVCLGVIADGPAIGKMLGRRGLRGFSGAQLIREKLNVSKSYIGTDTHPVFNARRYVTNKVCRPSYFFFVERF